MATKQEKFFSEVYAGARQRGLSDAQARLAASQASLETGYGRSMPGGNMFGIKAGSSWKGPTQDLQTWEDQGGRVNIVDKFRSYTNPFDSLGDWAGLMDRRYPAAASANSFTEAVGGLNAGQPGGYATDRNYGSKLQQIDGRFGQAAQQNYGTMGRDLPVPSPAPRGIMDALGSTPAEVATFEDRGLRSASFPNVPQSVQRQNLAPVGFDAERFGPAPSTVNFDAGRFGTATTPNQGMDGLRQGLLASNAQLAAPQGILGSAQASPMPSSPSALASQYAQYGMGQAAMQAALAPGVQAANLAADVADQRAKLGLAPLQQPVQPGYVDPMVSTVSPQTAQPAQPAQAARSSPYTQQGIIGGMAFPEAPKNFRNELQQMLGGAFGGIVGGMVGGPLGAVGGGLLGQQLGKKDNRISYDNLNRGGKDAYNESKQFKDAVDSKSPGLW